MDNESLVKYISGNLPLDERKAVYDWIMSSDDNQAEYRLLRRLHDISLWQSPLKKRKKRTALRYAAMFAAGFAAVALIAGLMATYMHDDAPDVPLGFRSITAPAGNELCMNLDDGTQVWLNSNSTLSVVDSEDGARRVFLDGEGYFKVAHDEEHPFIVQTKGLDVKVLGTEFNVSSYPEKGIWEAALFEGAVAVLDRNEQEILTIAPGTKVAVEDGRLVASRLNKNNYLWRDGVLYFDNMKLSDILVYLSEYYRFNLEVPASSRLDKCYTGKFRAVDGYDHILKVLKSDSGFNYQIRHDAGNTYVKISI